MAQARNLLVPEVVKCIKPDVLLLQEIPSEKIIDEIIDIMEDSNEGSLYEYMSAGREDESRVIYDSSKYTFVSFDAILEEAIEKVVPEGRQLRGRRVQGDRKVFKNRISIVGLKPNSIEDMKEAEKKTIIFISFHNIRRGAAAAALFCKIVVEMHEQTKAVIVAGADLNCRDFEKNGVDTPDYETTKRRKGRKVDFFILRCPAGYSVVPKVKALDFVDVQPEDDDTNPLHRVVRDLLRDRNLDMDDYKLALDHDPLVCDLKITVPI